MQTKSNIQLIKEGLAFKEPFKCCVETFMNQYLVEDNIFAYDKQRQSLAENQKGYFVIDSEYDNLADAVKYMNENQSIRIIKNEKFQIGRVYEKLSNIKSGNVYVIETGESLNIGE